MGDNCLKTDRKDTPPDYWALFFFISGRRTLPGEEWYFRVRRGEWMESTKKALPRSSTLLSPLTLPWPKEVHFPHISLLSPSPTSPCRGDGYIGMECCGHFSSSFSLVQQSCRGPRKQSIAYIWARYMWLSRLIIHFTGCLEKKGLL